jgi:hypothetical protein
MNVALGSIPSSASKQGEREKGRGRDRQRERERERELIAQINNKNILKSK